MTAAAIDPITFAVVKNGLDTIVDDMAYTVMRTSRSSIVRDVLDYSCTIADRHGRILTQAKTVALHLGAVPDAIEAMLDAFGDDFDEGDVVILNDPYQGGMHLPDIFMFKPLFFEGALCGFAVVIAHHCDMGGRVPGSNAADSTEIFQEGLRIPPSKLFMAGRANETLFNIIRRNVRLPELVVGDLDAQVATCNIGARAFERLYAKHGVDALEGYFDALLDYGERLTRAAIREWPDGRYEFTDYIDGDGFSEDALAIKAAVTVDGDGLEIDFAGSAPQTKGAINSTFSFTKSSAYLSVRCMLGQDVPNNAGVYRCIDVKAEEGSILNPKSPAPVAARALTGYRVVDAVLGALAQITPEKAMAAGEGGNTVLSFGGYEPGEETPFVLVDMINGAWGGRADKDGVEGVTNPSQNMSNLPIETLEARYPLIMEEYSLRPDSGGPGRFRGGLGLTRQYRLLADEAVLQIRADRSEHAPYGLFGGGPAAHCRNVLNPDGDDPKTLPAKATLNVRSGVVLRHEQAGGGGYGDPLSRDLDLIEDDLREGKTTQAFAETHYGVVFSGGVIDRDATATRRAERQP